MTLLRDRISGTGLRLPRVRPSALVASCLTAAALAAFACSGAGHEREATATAAAARTSPSEGCGTARAPGEYAETIESGGRRRSYVLHLPPRYDGSIPAGLVLAFHGYGLTPQYFARYTDLAASTDRRNEIIVLPEALGENLVWNVSQDPSQPDDARFATELLDHLEQVLCVDRTRIYATGFSLGGEMSQLMACLVPGRIAAIGVVASAFSGCTAPVPMLVVHGTTDPSIPFLGGSYPAEVGRGPAPAIRDVVEGWARGLGCEAAARVDQLARDVVVSRHEECDRGETGVVLYVVEGGGHVWPGSPHPLAEAVAGRSTSSIRASELIAAFFESHQLPG